MYTKEPSLVGNDLPEEVILKQRCDGDIGELGKDEENGLITLDETSGAVGTVLSLCHSLGRMPLACLYRIGR